MNPSEIPLTHRDEVLRTGWTDHDLRRCERRGELVRVRRGSYADPRVVTELDAEQRHRLAVDVATRAPTPCVLSHASAAVLWGMPLVDVDLRRVHFIRPGAAGGRRSAARVDHGGALPAADITRRNGILVTTPARTLVDLARTDSPRASVVAADHGLHHRQTDPVALEEVLDRCSRMPGIGTGRQALRRVDGRSESPGETLTRLAVDGLGALDAQVELRGPRHRFVARVDLAVEDALTVIEFDGRQKYLALRAPGQSVEDAVLAEKRRALARTLSGGQRQILAMAMGLMAKPALMLLDEPTAGLSPRAADELFDAVIDLNRGGLPVLMVEQHAVEALRISHRGYVLVSGRNSVEGPGPALAEDPEIRRLFLGG